MYLFIFMRKYVKVVHLYLILTILKNMHLIIVYNLSTCYN